MNIWILTIGSSDVQLKTKANWTKLFRIVRSQVDDRGFNPIDGIEGRFQVPARVMGVVYNQPQAEQHFDDLVFPLIDNFIGRIKGVTLDKIILALSDQSVFSSAERSSQHHPYWQDTCTLQPILEKHLKNELKDCSPNLHIQPLFLRPTSSTTGLDDWDSVLKLVQHEFSQLELPDSATIYVSHQASTPAISSAVQFTSLAEFGKQVSFLVSNEWNSTLTRVLDSSAYLKGIRQQEAKALLDRYDYAGVQGLIAEYLDCDTKTLLEAAIQWNFAEFDTLESDKTKSKNPKQDNFADRLKQHPKFTAAVDDRTKLEKEDWWWTAYESAYLGFVRLEQGDTVEAMFHSFRAVEGLLKTWSDKCYPGELQQTKHPRWQENERWDRNLRSYGQDLYWFLTLKKLVDENKDIKQNKTPDIFIFGTRGFDKRNDLFHNLKGLQGQEKVFEIWRSPNEPQWKSNPVEKWKMRVLNCLNFISDQSFVSLKEASLMAKVHKELVSAIAQL